MHTERLNHLITVLQNVPPDKLDMAVWRNACGTAGCAVGWACVDPVFNAQGLHIGSKDTPQLGEETPTSWLNAWEYAGTFFGLDHEQVQYLFNGSYYMDDEDPDPAITPQDVITRIKELLS